MNEDIQFQIECLSTELVEMLMQKYGWDIVSENTTYHINGKDTIRFITNTTTDQTIYFANIDALETTYPEIAEYFKSYSDAFISIMGKKMQSSVGKDNQEGQTACHYAERIFTNALLKLSNRKTLTDIENDKAAIEAERASFIKSLDMTEDDFNTVLADIENFDIKEYEIAGYEKNPVSAFCKTCRELGYEIYDMDLISAGEEFYATMRRSTNGGGENSPMLEGEDDFYELFFASLESL